MRGKIFEFFFATQPGSKDIDLGPSLNFNIVVKQHDGQLSVARKPDNYTKFNITLPRAHVEERTKEDHPFPCRQRRTDVETLFRQQFCREVHQGL